MNKNNQVLLSILYLHGVHKIYFPKYPLWIANIKFVLRLLNRILLISIFYYLEGMEKLVYKNNYEITNAIDFGIPQNRECIFIVKYIEISSS